MRLTGIELLQRIKDGKIKVGTKIIDEYGFKYIIKKDSDEFIYVYDDFNQKEAGCSNFLSDKNFEIIENQNKIIRELKANK